MYALILAGGAGTRFWPHSRTAKPKQLLELLNGTSLIRQTWQRLNKYPGLEGLYTIAGPALADGLAEQLPEVPPERMLLEPAARSTAPAIALAALVLRKRHGDVVMGVFPADHLIRKETRFYKALDAAAEKTATGEYLITLGIQPTYPATGYGYVEFDRDGPGDVHPVVTFTEKPGLEKAKGFLEGGRHLWNGGMFIWKVSTILDRLAKHLPRTYERLAALEELIDTPEFQPALEQVWPEVDAISIDYGVLEHASDIYTVEARFEWYDLGGWRALYDLLPKQKGGNATQGDVALLDSRNTLVVSEGRFTAVIGADDLVVVSTADATLVVPRSQADRVGEIITWLRSRNRDELL